MATELLPLNRFRNVSQQVTTTSTLVYDVGANLSAIILNSIFVNYTDNEREVYLLLRKQGDDHDYSLVPGLKIPPREILTAISGRMVLAQGDQLLVQTDLDDSVDYIMSLNEAANE